MQIQADEEVAPARLALIGVGDRGERLARQATCGFARDELMTGSTASRIEALDRLDPDMAVILCGLEQADLKQLHALVNASRGWHILTVVVATWPASVRDPEHLAAIEAVAKRANAFISVPGRPGAEGLTPDPIGHDASAVAVARMLSDMVRREQIGVVDLIPLFDLLAVGGLSVVGTGVSHGHDFDAAIDTALDDPALEGADLVCMQRVHLQLRGSLHLEPSEVNPAVRRIRQRFGVCNHVTWSLVFDPSLGDKVRATLLATRWQGAPAPGPRRPAPEAPSALPFPSGGRRK